MSKYRQAAKTDNNQSQIVKELRQIPGVTVVTGHDDLLIGYKGKTYWFEIKDPEMVGKDGNVRPSAIKESQKSLLANYTGHYRIVWSIDQILSELEVK